MADARLARINVTPVKSLRLNHPDEIELVPDGAREDRRFLLVDGDRRLYNGKRDATLVRTSAAWDPGSRVLEVTLPDGRTVSDEVAPGEATVVEVYRRARRVRGVGGPGPAPMTEHVGGGRTRGERDDGGWGTDDRPASIVSRASLETIDGDGRRFRMLLELDDLAPHGEDAWRNRRVRIGEATLLVGDPTPRCAVPSVNPDTGIRDRDVLRELLEKRGPIEGEPCMGVYAEVLEPGVVRVGDGVELV